MHPINCLALSLSLLLFRLFPPLTARKIQGHEKSKLSSCTAMSHAQRFHRLVNYLSFEYSSCIRKHGIDSWLKLLALSVACRHGISVHILLGG